MKKLLVVLFIIFICVSLNANRFWNDKRNFKQILTVDSILSYNLGVANYVYGNYNYKDMNYYELQNNNDIGHYFYDSIDWQHLFNIYPCFQFGTVLNYRWGWGLRVFSFSNLYRVCGFNIDVYNLSFTISFADLGYSIYKYGWFDTDETYTATYHFLLSPISTGIQYRIDINNIISSLIYIGYSQQFIFPNIIYFKDHLQDYSFVVRHEFKAGLGFRFYTINFK